jgi:predicted esterase YcpF (UPF0227 family)
MTPSAPDVRQLLLLVQLGDELLDQQQTLELLHGAQTVCEAGGCHAFDRFERHMATIRRFADATT